MKKKGLLPVLFALCLLIAGCGRTHIAKESITAATTSDSVQTNENGSETANPESLRDGRNESGRNTEAGRTGEPIPGSWGSPTWKIPTSSWL